MFGVQERDKGRDFAGYSLRWHPPRLLRTHKTVERKPTTMSAASRAIFVIAVVVAVIGFIWGLMSVTKANDLSSLPLQTQLSEEKVRRLETILESVPPSEMLERWSEVRVETVAEWVEDPSLKIKRDIKKYGLFAWIGFGLTGMGVLGIASSLLLPGSGREESTR